MTEKLKQKIDKIVRDYYTSSKALTLYQNLKELAYDITEETRKELQEKIEKMKSDVKQEQSYWNSGEMQYDLYQRLLDKWVIKEND